MATRKSQVLQDLENVRVYEPTRRILASELFTLVERAVYAEQNVITGSHPVPPVRI